MSECNLLYNTPVRHDDLSMTRKSIQPRVQISSFSSKEHNCDKSKENSRLNGSQVYSSTKLLETSSFNQNKDESCDSMNNKWETSSFKIDVAQMEEGTQEENMDTFSSDHCDTKDSIIIHEQKHSTPQVMKFSIKAVSSTPNQELFNLSKFTRNVFTQTNFTLNVRNEDNLSENLMSYCTEIPDNKSPCELSNAKTCLDTTSELLTSPLSHLCSSKVSECDVTPVKNKQLVRKLSLRSKTMICSAIEKSKEIPKKIISRHKSMEEKRIFSNTFSLLPNPKTPPSFTGKVFHNPFEVDLPDRLSKTIFSPDVFDNVVSPSQDLEDLRWTIEDISSINPVPIDEDFSVPSDEEDPERESQVQQEIDRYFSETHVVLSPENEVKSPGVVEIIKNKFHTGTASSTPRKVQGKLSTELKSSSSQTTLSLPETLPEELECRLKLYFKIYENDDFNMSQCNLRRKLFFHTEDEPPSPVRFDMNSSPMNKEIWNAESSPLSIICRERHFTPESHRQELSSPEISPVVDEFPNPKMKDDSLITCKKTLHNFFHGDSRSVKTDRKKDVVNSSVITTSDMDSSSQPASQDTGYQTEESVSSHLHFSTPTRTVI